MKDFARLFEDKLSRKQVRLRIEKFVLNKILEKQGEGSTSMYKLSDNYIKEMEVITEALNIGMKEMEKKGKSKNWKGQERTRKRPVNC